MADLTWLRAEYELRKRNAEKQVEEWHAYSNQIFDPRPFYFESHRYRRGRRVSPQAKYPAALYRYGFGKQGRVWVEQQATEFKDRLYETFFIYGPEGPAEAAGFDYSSEKRPIFLDRFIYSERRLVRYEKHANQCLRSSYIYAGNRLVRIEHEVGPAFDKLKLYQIEDVTFDDAGGLTEIACRQLDPDGKEEATEVRFRAKPRNLSARELDETFLRHLVSALPSALGALPDLGPAYCLVLPYDPGQFSTLPPRVALGLVMRLADAGYEPWNPATMWHIDLDRGRFPELYRLADLLDQRPLSSKSLRTLLNEAAKRLSGLDWSRILPVTEDFVVYATDLELVDLGGNLRKVLPKEKIRQLSARARCPPDRTA